MGFRLLVFLLSCCFLLATSQPYPDCGTGGCESCNTWTGICDRCPTNFSPVQSAQGGCVPCAVGTYSTGQECKPCDSACSACTSGSNSGCTCASNAYNWYGNCNLCPASCSACTNSDSCTSCTAGYFKSGGSCLACSSDCVACSSASVCTECRSGFDLVANACQPGFGTCNTGKYFDGSTCKDCAASCTACSGSPTTCSSCAAGYYLSGSSCLSCHASCGTCTGANSNQCTGCKVGFRYESGSKQCFACNPTETSAGGIAQNCQGCSGSCMACSGSTTTCTTCRANRYLSAPGVCSDCPAGTYTADGNSAASCTSCTTVKANCNSCTATTCNSCKAGYYLSGGNCVACPTGCTECTSSTVCTACQPSHYILGGQNGMCQPCGTTGGCTNCDWRTGICNAGCQAQWEPAPTAGGGCQACTAGKYGYGGGTNCTSCWEGCTTCTGPGRHDECLGCKVGYSRNLDTPTAACQACPEGCATCHWTDPNVAVCDTCKTGFYPTGGSCASCALGCATCTGPSSGQCSVWGCAEGSFYNDPPGRCCLGTQSCAANNKAVCATADTACVACATNQYPNNGVCAACSTFHAQCATCTASGCSVCNVGYYADAGTCKPCDTGCAACTGAGLTTATCQTCKAKYYRLDADICRPCGTDNGCTDCSASTGLCTACPANSTPGNNAGTGCVACAAGKFSTGGTAACTGCTAGCASCTGAGLDNTNCQTCAAGYYRSAGGVCTAGTTTNGCNSWDANGICTGGCNPGSTPGASAGTGCVACGAGSYSTGGSAACVACSTLHAQCTACSAGTCTACSAGYYASGNTCLPCHASCAVCTGPGATASTCQSCKPNFYRLAGPDNGCTACSTENGCSGCDANTGICAGGCAVNFAPGSSAGTGCIACPADFTSPGGSAPCVQSCGAGFYSTGGPSSTCVACTTLDAHCTSCTSDSCTACSAGFYASGTTCLPCDSACAECTAPGLTSATCQTCKPNFYRLAAADAVCTACSTANGCTSCNPTTGICMGGCAVNSAPGATADSGCVACPSSSYSVGGNAACVACTTHDAHCLGCSATACTSCAAGYYPSEKQCLSCDSSCAQCTGAGATAATCQVCKPGFYRFAGGDCRPCSTQGGCTACDANTGVCTAGCPVNTEPGAAGTGCVACQNGGTSPGGNVACTAGCPDAACASCTSGTCDACKAGYYLTGGSCILCNDGCDLCQEMYGASFCSKCKPGYSLNFGGTCCLGESSCHEVNKATCTTSGGACVSCAGNEFSENGYCSACPAGCASCWDWGCTSCLTGFTLKDNVCRLGGNPPSSSTGIQLSLGPCPTSLSSLPPPAAAAQRFTAKLKASNVLTNALLQSFHDVILGSMQSPNGTLTLMCYEQTSTGPSIVCDFLDAATPQSSGTTYTEWQQRVKSDSQFEYLLEDTQAVTITVEKKDDNLTWPNLTQIRSKLPLYMLCGLAGIYALGFGIIWVGEQRRQKDAENLAIYLAFPGGPSWPVRLFRAVFANHLWVSAFTADLRSSFSGFKRLTLAISSTALQMAVTAALLITNPRSPPIVAYSIASAIIAGLYTLPVAVVFSRPDRSREVARDIFGFVLALCVGVGSAVLLLLMAIRFVPVSGAYSDLTPSWLVCFIVSFVLDVVLISPVGLVLLALAVYRFRGLPDNGVQRLSSISKKISVRRKNSLGVSEDSVDTPTRKASNAASSKYNRSSGRYTITDHGDPDVSVPANNGPGTVVVLMPIMQQPDIGHDEASDDDSD